jgi:predicted PurR-regulated permease PerM
MAIIGVGTTAGLLVLRMPLALILGLLTTFLSFIPNLGIVIAMVPVTLLALVQGPTTALCVIGIYLAVQAFDANVVMPFVIQRTVLIPPALVIFAELLMGSLAGLLGVLLATPMLAVIMAVVKLLYVRDTLDDEVEMPGDDERPGKGAG